jgi:hypothetical protein
MLKLPPESTSSPPIVRDELGVRPMTCGNALTRVKCKSGRDDIGFELKKESSSLLGYSIDDTLSVSGVRLLKKVHLASSSREGKLWRQLVGIGLSHKSISDPGGGGPSESRLKVDGQDGPDVSVVEVVRELDHAEAKLESSEPVKKSVEPSLEELSSRGARSGMSNKESSESHELTVWTL